VYAIVASSDPLHGYSERLAPSVGIGIAYGVATAVLLASLLMPMWLEVVGFQNVPPLPNITLTSIVGHVVYGGVLGIIYAVLEVPEL
ncbi:MAG: histidine kinase, partial [Halobacteria archaeon]|nr:histidine kinase [Halobacteria archaeon]